MSWLIIALIFFFSFSCLGIFFALPKILQEKKLRLAQGTLLLWNIFGILTLPYSVVPRPVWWARGLLEAVVIGFVVQVFLLGLVFVAVCLRFFWRQVKTVPVDKNRRQLLKHAALYPAVAVGVSLYGGLEERTHTVTRKFTIPIANLGAFHGYRIAQISDVHLGYFYSNQELQTLLECVAQEKPDVLCVTGDLFDDVSQNDEAARILDSYVPRFPDGIYFIRGNHEHYRGMNHIESLLQKIRVKELVNTAVCVHEGERPLWFIGVDYPMDRQHFAEIEKAYAREAFAHVPAEAVKIFLAHHPDFFDDGLAHGADFTLSGHTHGCQFGFLGMPLIPVFKYNRGLYHFPQMYGYVHSGNGSWFPFRIGCPPEVAYFTLVEA